MKTGIALLLGCVLVGVPSSHAQAPVPVYTDNLVNGFQNWSWATVNFANVSPVQSGGDSISVSGSPWEGLWLYHADFNTALYSNVSFWMNGGSTGGQIVEVTGIAGGDTQESYDLGPLPANAWQQFTISFATLGLANTTNCNGFWFRLTGNAASTYYVDTVQLNLFPASSQTTISVKAAQPVRTADSRWFGINAATWDGYLDTSTTISEFKQAGWTTLRFPGGSESDIYDWTNNTIVTNGASAGGSSFSQFANVATNIGAQVIITANYGTGTPAEAAAWVANSNVTNHYGFEYWEIGNELYGTWEVDSNVYPHDPYTYATRAQSYIQQMKAVDTNIKVGVVVIPGEDANSNGYMNHPATNATTGQVHYGWTPVLMSTLRRLGVTPDFAIYHWYPESGSDSDPFLLQGTSNWAGDAANLRGMIANYFGPGGTNIELLCTENNSDSGPPGKQSVSLVNALYYADSLCQLMQTQFNSYLWWDLRNNEETDGDMDPALYGWRMYGDLGVMNQQAADLPDRYPTFFSAQLMQYFIRGGDTVLSTTSSYALLSAYSVRRTNGELTLLVINKDPATTFAGNINLNGFTPNPSALIYAYGMPQDNAAEAGSNSCGIAETNFIATTNFNYSFAPYSLTLFVFPPMTPTLGPGVAPAGSSQFVLQLSGQPGTPYVLQTSSNLTTWTAFSTNTLTTSTLSITNTPPPGSGHQFWRAVWHP